MAKKLEIPPKILTLKRMMTNHSLMKLQEWNKLMKLQEWSKLIMINLQIWILMASLQEWTSMPSPQEWRLKLTMVKYMKQLPKNKRTMDSAKKFPHQMYLLSLLPCDV